MKLLLHKNFNSCFIYLLLIFTFPSEISLAQTVEIVNPLTVNFEDELLPKIKRDLTNLEKKEFKKKLMN